MTIEVQRREYGGAYDRSVAKAHFAEAEAGMEITMHDLYERLGKIEVRTEHAEQAAVERHDRIEKAAVERYERIDKRLERIEEAIHGNGKPGLANRIMDIERWRDRIHWTAAGAALVISAIGTAIGFIVGGGVRAVLGFFRHQG